MNFKSGAEQWKPLDLEKRVPTSLAETLADKFEAWVVAQGIPETELMTEELIRVALKKSRILLAKPVTSDEMIIELKKIGFLVPPVPEKKRRKKIAVPAEIPRVYHESLFRCQSDIDRVSHVQNAQKPPM